MSDVVKDLLEELIVDLNYECEAKKKDKPLWGNNFKIDPQVGLVVKESPCAKLDNTRQLNGVNLCGACYRTIRMYQRLYKDLMFRRDTIRGIEFLRWDVNNLTEKNTTY